MHQISQIHAATHWPLDTIASQNWVRQHSGKTGDTRYPVKLFRYWFTYHLIHEEYRRRNRPLRICEIGVDRGQMLVFAHTAGGIGIERWDAIDYRLKPGLEQRGYSRQIEVDVEQDDFHLDDDYDVIIALHLIEHLLEPERFMQRLASFARSDAVVIGGFPVTPDWAAPAWERHLRRTIWRTPENYGHVSVFSPQRVSRMAATCGWKLEFLTGAFLIRKTGAFIENHAFWARLNLLWGAAFPALGGEIYWRMRRA